ncbi:MAG: hypothetical protein R3304_10050 [Longimicrobiales bacterium]|nr:hypothetical protein [Longimicrobiales bacterium]
MMIYRRYGTSYQSVDVDFSAEALNEIGFRRNREDSFPVDELEDRFELMETVELSAEASGAVQNETEQVLLDRLETKLDEQLQRVPEGGIAVVENESGRDYPRTHQETKTVLERGENKLHFEYTMSPPLRVALYRPG